MSKRKPTLDKNDVTVRTLFYTDAEIAAARYATNDSGPVESPKGFV